MAHLYRERSDSSQLTAPRVLARVFADPGRFDETVDFYERLTGALRDLELDLREAGLRLAAVGGFLVLELDDAVLDRAAVARQTSVSMIFADLDDAIAAAVVAGAVLVSTPIEVPTGRAARLRHPDGVLVEYLEHRPGPYDTGTGR